MLLKTIQKEIHERALKCAREFKRAEAELLTAIEAVDREKVYRALGYANMFEYTVRELRLSEAVAFNFIAVARKSREIPAIQARVASGEMSVSKVRKILPVLTPENQDHWLTFAAESTSRVIEKEVARVQPQTAVPEKVSYVNGMRVQMQVGVNEELMLRFRRVQDLESQRQKKPVRLEEALDVLVGEYLQKHDPVKKAERAVVKKGQPPVPGQADVTKAAYPSKRQPLPAAIKHTVMLKYQGRCAHTHPKTGARCAQKRWLEIHHIHPVSHGGQNTPENLTLLCASHHQAEHR